MDERGSKVAEGAKKGTGAQRKDLTIPMNSGIAPELAGFRLRLNRGREEAKTVYPAKALRRKVEVKSHKAQVKSHKSEGTGAQGQRTDDRRRRMDERGG